MPSRERTTDRHDLPLKSSGKTDRILAAARSLLAQYGYAGTTIARVAEEAGVSRGLLHYHFENKEHLIAKVLRENMDNSTQVLAALIDESDSAGRFARNLVQAFKKLALTDPDYFSLFVEGLAAARHSDVVRQELSGLYLNFRNVLHSGLERMLAKGCISPRISLAGVALVIMEMLDGLGIQLMTVRGLAMNEEVWTSLEQMLILLLTGEAAA